MQPFDGAVWVCATRLSSVSMKCPMHRQGCLADAALWELEASGHVCQASLFLSCTFVAVCMGNTFSAASCPGCHYQTNLGFPAILIFTMQYFSFTMQNSRLLCTAHL